LIQIKQFNLISIKKVLMGKCELCGRDNCSVTIKLYNGNEHGEYCFCSKKCSNDFIDETGYLDNNEYSNYLEKQQQLSEKIKKKNKIQINESFKSIEQKIQNDEHEIRRIIKRKELRKRLLKRIGFIWLTILFGGIFLLGIFYINFFELIHSKSALNWNILINGFLNFKQEIVNYILNSENYNKIIIFYHIYFAFAILYVLFYLITKPRKIYTAEIEILLYFLFLPLIFGLGNWLWEILSIFVVPFLIYIIPVFRYEMGVYDCEGPCLYFPVAYGIIRLGIFIHSFFVYIPWLNGLLDVISYILLLLIFLFQSAIFKLDSGIFDLDKKRTKLSEIWF